MSTPREIPPAGIVADMLAIRQYDQALDADTRYLCEVAADTLRALLVANARYANRAEHLEAECETYAAMIYGRGGAR